MLFSKSSFDIQYLYMAHLGRPAEPEGLQFWDSKVLNGQLSIAEVSALIAASPEANHEVHVQTVEYLVNKMYLNLFGRQAEPAGLHFWSDLVTHGTVAMAELPLVLAHAAQNADQSAVSSKLTACFGLTTSVSAGSESYYKGDAACAVASAWLAQVHDQNTLSHAMEAMPHFFAPVEPAPSTLSVEAMLHFVVPVEQPPSTLSVEAMPHFGVPVGQALSTPSVQIIGHMAPGTDFLM